MSKKGENIRKRKDGRWEGRVRVYNELTAKRSYKSIYGKTYREVKERICLYHASPAPSPSVSPASSGKSGTRTFAEILYLWLSTNRIRLKGGTINKYQYIIDKHIVPTLGAIEIRYLTADRINTFLFHELEEGRLDGEGGLSPSYVRTIMLVIKAAHQYAVERNLCPPLSGSIYKPSIPKKDLQILNKVQQKHLENHLLHEPPSIVAGIYLSLHAGLRIGEICALSWTDVDMENKLLHVRHTIACVPDPAKGHKLILDTPKTKASFRDIPISSTLYNMLAQCRQSAVSTYVISNSRNHFMNPRTFEYQFHQVLRRASLDDINFHALRHTFATRCIEVGVDVKTLSEILGHSNAAITLNTYVHSSMDLKRLQIEKLC